MMEIVAADLGVGYGSTPVLSGVNLRLRAGELTGLIGPNGSGKTTLLRVLAGLDRPLAGELRLDGRPASEMSRRDLARRIAYLAQGGEVNWEITAGRLVALGRLPHRRAFVGPGPRDADAIARALHAASASHLAHRTVSTLSGGERARVVLARALAVEAEMLLADEPVAALDPLHQLGAMQVFRDAADRGTGVVLVLHDLALAARFCDRIVLLAGGRVLADGAPGDVMSDGNLAEAFGIAVLRGTHLGRPFVLPWSPIQFPAQGASSDAS